MAALVASIHGDDLDTLARIGRKAEAAARRVLEAWDVRMQQQSGKGQIRSSRIATRWRATAAAWTRF